MTSEGYRVWQSPPWFKCVAQVSTLTKNSLPLFCEYVISLFFLVAQSYLTLCDPIDCCPPGSSVHGILQVRIVNWDAIPFSRGSS